MQMKLLKQTVKDQTMLNRGMINSMSNDLKDHITN